MKKITFVGLLAIVFIQCKSAKTISKSASQFYQSTNNKSQQMQLQTVDSKSDGIKIIVDANQKFQTMDGFGITLTGGSAWAINQKLDESGKDKLLKELFSTTENGIGLSYLRVTIGASDMNEYPYTYDDLSDGETDINLEKFSLAEDEKDVIPILKKIVAIHPNIKILGSPWSAPKWMKTNNSFKGGKLKPEYYGVYAQYFVKYIQKMRSLGINLDAITIQNEPENPKNNPSMEMTASEQADFIKNHLGKAFESNKITTKILLFDHNCDHPNYPISILDDADAKKYIDGSAFHLYAGDIYALTKTHNAHPDKNVYFTEQWNWTKGNYGGDLAWGIKNLVIGASRNWSKTVLQWNLASDQYFRPYTPDGGCNECLAMVTVNDNKTIDRNVAYYTIGHVSRFVPTGSIRLGSSETVNRVSNVAFLTPNGQKAMILLNENTTTQNISVQDGQNYYSIQLEGGAVGTLVW